MDGIEKQDDVEEIFNRYEKKAFPTVNVMMFSNERFRAILR
jgi:hypothetical protein